MSHALPARRFAVAPHRSRPLPVAVAAALVLASGAAAAQATVAGSTVVVTGNPLAADRLVQPSSVLAGDGLVLRRGGSLGETLDGLPGVASTAFGPNVGRPVVRGLDGDRVRLLDHGGASVDASSLSFDHAVGIDPLVVERIEVLRGPAALLYGGSATGGVVNVLHNRIPRLPMTGIGGRAELRAGGAAGERSGAAVLEGGTAGGLAWHADAFSRRTDDLKVPRHTPLEADGSALDPSERVRNSASNAEGGAFGAGWAGRQGFVGVAVDGLSNRYGITAEPDVKIRLKRERAALAAGWTVGGGFVDRIGVEASRTNYRHVEVEGTGEVGTRFASIGDEARLELRHAPLAALGGARGVFGVQGESLDFSALGEEAFVPPTKTRGSALFWLEEWTLPGELVISAGARAERVKVDSRGDADPAAPRFGGPRSRSFSPHSYSLGLRGGAAVGGGRLEWNTHLASTERAPAYYELYADGVHLATAAYERGDPTLATERSRHAEAGIAWRTAEARVALSVFRTRFANYIALDATGALVSVPGEPGDPPEDFPEYAFRSVRAKLSGLELEGRWRPAGAPFAAWGLEATGTLDLVRGDNLSTGEPLPRLPPRRLTLGLEAGSGAWRGGLQWRHAAAQDRVPATDRPTAGWRMLDLWARWRLPLPGDTALLLKATNLGDEQAYSATTVATLRGLAPLPGRALSATLSSRF